MSKNNHQDAEAMISMADHVLDEQNAVVNMSDDEFETIVRELRENQSLVKGFLAGSIAALAGAAIWAIISIVSGYQVGLVAIAVGFLVGFAVQKGGKGIDPIYGIMGGSLALIACLLGNFFMIVGAVAKHENMAFLDVLNSIALSKIVPLMTATFSMMDLVFYGIAVYEGYKLAFYRD